MKLWNCRSRPIHMEFWTQCLRKLSTTIETAWSQNICYPTSRNSTVSQVLQKFSLNDIQILNKPEYYSKCILVLYDQSLLWPLKCTNVVSTSFTLICAQTFLGNSIMWSLHDLVYSRQFVWPWHLIAPSSGSGGSLYEFECNHEQAVSIR